MATKNQQSSVLVQSITEADKLELKQTLQAIVEPAQHIIDNIDNMTREQVTEKLDSFCVEAFPLVNEIIEVKYALEQQEEDHEAMLHSLKVDKQRMN